MMRISILMILLFSMFSNVYSQDDSELFKLVESKLNAGVSFQNVDVLNLNSNHDISFRENIPYEMFSKNDLNIQSLLRNRPEAVNLKLNFQGEELDLLLVEQDILADGFNVVTSSGNNDFNYNGMSFYRGIINGQKNSLVAISFSEEEIIGVIDSEDEKNLVLGAVKGTNKRSYVLYDINKISNIPDFDCDVEMIEGISDMIDITRDKAQLRVDNCVNVYFECEHDFYLDEGSVQATVNQMTGIFNVVSTIYANEQITTQISEIKVWDTPDNYTTTSPTSNALYDFRNKVPSYNGDLAHLVSRGAPSGGGVAFLNGLCNSYGYAYSYIYSSYSQFPTYSWTVNVIAHEMGHNLGSNHTHDCVWNGNNTAIDGCGPAAGYSSGSCPTAPLPSNGGTVMSYCHLLGSVGINLNNGFGPQPGDRIRNNINNASCLATCGTCTNEGLVCDDGNPCTINDVYDANCNCSGTPEIDTDNDGVCDSQDQCPGFDDNLIGTSCDDGDVCTTNDVYTSSCNCAGTYADSDNDGVCDADDICPGFDDSIDSDNDGIPDGCDVDCIITSGSFGIDPLAHSGSGSSESTIVFDRLSQNILFTISGIDAVLGGKPSDRFEEAVTVTYLDENNITQTYGSFSGGQGSSFSVNIQDRAKSVTVTLFDGYDGSAPGLSVNLGTVQYCEDDFVCQAPDSDGDGICDDNDQCPGFDDKIDSDGDGIPDGCDSCNDVFDNFNTNTLAHSGTGSNTTTKSFGQILESVQFSISDLDARTNGRTDRRYIESVEVTYVDGSGNTQTYGTFSGENISVVAVSIAAASSVTITITDGYDGDSGTNTLSVQLSEINGCSNIGAAPILGETIEGKLINELTAFPNPVTDLLYVNYSNPNSKSEVVTLKLIDMNGRMIMNQKVSFAGLLNETMNVSEVGPAIYVLQVQDGNEIKNEMIAIIKR